MPGVGVWEDEPVFGLPSSLGGLLPLAAAGLDDEDCGPSDEVMAREAAGRADGCCFLDLKRKDMADDCAGSRGDVSERKEPAEDWLGAHPVARAGLSRRCCRLFVAAGDHGPDVVSDWTGDGLQGLCGSRGSQHRAGRPKSRGGEGGERILRLEGGED